MGEQALKLYELTGCANWLRGADLWSEPTVLCHRARAGIAPNSVDANCDDKIGDAAPPGAPFPHQVCDAARCSSTLIQPFG